MSTVKENYLMLWITTLVVGLSGIIYVLHHVFGIFNSYLALMGIYSLSGNLRFTFVLLVGITLALLIASWVLYKRDAEHPRLRLLLTLTLTHGSMLIIAAGNGLVEYHFSIFMVLAFITYFNSISLIVVSTVIFAVHHLAGYFLFPELLCGTADYRFSLLMIHAVFLVLTSGANITLTLFNRRMQEDATRAQQEANERFQLIVDNLTKTMADLTSVTESVERGATESRLASGEIALSTQQLKEGSENQLEQAEENIAHLQTVTGAVVTLGESTTDILQQAVSAAELAGEGERLIDETTTQFQSVHERSSYLEQSFRNFHQRIHDVKGFVLEITDIANQTNLLALNASIEAARAGEQGSGFSVVAEEVRKLAHQSEASANNVNMIVNEITLSSNEIVEEITLTVQRVLEGMGQLQTTNIAFTHIQEATSMIEQQMQSIYKMVEEINRENEQLSQSMNGLQLVSNEGLLSSQQISAAAEEQFASIESLNHSTDHLQKLTESVEALIEQIK